MGPGQMLERWDGEADTLNKSAQFKEVQNLYTKAISQLLEEFPDSEERKRSVALALNSRGLSHYKQVNFNEAVEDYNVALEYDPSLACAYYNRATVSYRLCTGYEYDKKLEELERAMTDFTKAVELQPDNLEFKEGKLNCEKFYKSTKGDGNASSKRKAQEEKILDWENISLGKLVTLLFILDNGDRSTGKSEKFREENEVAAKEVLSAFRAFLIDRESSKIRELLERRVKCLNDYIFVAAPKNLTPEGEDACVRKNDEDLLTFLEGCQFLDITCNVFHAKRANVEKKLGLNEKESQGNFFIYAENIRVSRICNQLSPNLIHKFWEVVREDKKLNIPLTNSEIQNPIQVSVDELEKVQGLKEALFFYIVRSLEVYDKLNRIYTDKLEELFERVKEKITSQSEEQIISNIVSTLSTYPDECQPKGHCIVFCVTKNRPGAEYEWKKIQYVFEKCFCYTVKVKVNPTKEDVDQFKAELEKEKYRFYDSLVLWFLSHGSENEIELADKRLYERKEIIDSFCKLANFRMKPKIIFMASCKGVKPIHVTNQGGMKVAVDGMNKDFQNMDIPYTHIPEGCHNITAVHYEMDKIIASATLPERYAFRISDGGSVYVDTVCSLLEKHKGYNITQVLEKACRKMHQILFSAANNEFCGEAKQACYYESTLQKTFIVPKEV